MMSDAIKNFHKQFKFKPKILQGSPSTIRPQALGREASSGTIARMRRYKTYVVCGMGGSHLAGDLLQVAYPEMDIVIHRNYGLPNLSEPRWKKALVIASSYSGNTEETISAYDEARQRGLAVVVIAVGGKLIELAQKNNTPYIQLPDTGIQPRSALGLSMKAMMKAMKLQDGLRQISELAKTLDPKVFEEQGKELAQKLKDHVPVIYSSQKNRPIVYNWKIKFNETGKIPAFYNTFPELNHNEMTGFDVKDSSKHLSKNFYFIFLKDSDDLKRVQKRMEVLEKLYRDRGFGVEVVQLKGFNMFHRIFSSLLIADWTAVYTAQNYGLESEQVPMVEEFKKLVTSNG